jgi:hypothetical protein
LEIVVANSRKFINYTNSIFLGENMNSRQVSLALGMIATLTSGIILPSHAVPSPSKGVICSTGFNGESVSGGFRCKKVVNVLIENVCTNPQFPKLNLRVGRDVCSKENVTIPATGPLTGLNPGRDFVNSQPDPAARQKAEQKLEQAFTVGKLALPTLAKKRPAVTLPVIPAGEREAVFVSQTVLTDDAGDIDDHTRVTFNVFVFPVQKP